VRFVTGFVAFGLVLSGRAGNAQVPNLRQVALRNLGTDGPERRNSHIAVTPQGAIAFTSGFDAQDRLVTIVDSTGRVLARAIPKGPGPGEANGVMTLLSSESTFAAYSPDGRLIVFRPSGAHVATHRLTAENAGAPLRLFQDSIDVLKVPGFNGIRRIALSSLGGRPLIPLGDATLAGLVKSTQPQGPPSYPAYVSFPGGVLVGHTTTYRLQRFDSKGNPVGPAFGRPLPPNHPDSVALAEVRRAAEAAAARGPQPTVVRNPDGTVAATAPPTRTRTVDERVAAEAARVIPHFGPTGLHVDGAGRVWVVRPTGNTTTFDVYRDGRLLGSRSIPCRTGGGSIAGAFLAIMCQSSHPDREVDLKLFKIEP
jgi:hypothetical protein